MNFPDSRLQRYQDALGNATTYGYDGLGRRTLTTYPDGTTTTVAYDATDNPDLWTDANGTVVDQTFDAAGRLTGRLVTPGPGVIGPTSESYGYDGLSRLTSATSGGITSTLVYDSLSRLRSDTTAGKTVTYDVDDAGNVTGEVLPSLFKVGRRYDALHRLEEVGEDVSGALTTSVAYTYRGRSRLAGKTAHSLSATRSHDAAGRPLGESVTTPDSRRVFGEQLSWSPRGLKVAAGRLDRNGLGHGYGYDGAGQLTTVATLSDPTAVLPNNTVPTAGQLSAGLVTQSHTYDAARNLLSRTSELLGATETVSTPPDASGRNRPAAVAGTPLAYDPNGNLTAKGDLGFAYDFRNRLSRVTDAGQEIALYTYDAFDRRIEKLIGGSVEHTVWSGWRPVETYRDSLLVGRQIHGRDLDEIAELHRNLDGDAVMETVAVPWYDSQGNPALLAAPDGRVVERYHYTPLGEREIRVDDTAPEIEQLRLRDEQIWLALSEEVDRGRFQDAITEGQVRVEDHTDPGASPLPQVTITWGDDPESLGTLSQVAASQTMSAVSRRQEQRRRIVLALPEPPPEGTPLRLVVEEAALQDLFANRPTGTWTQSFAWTSADSVVDDTTPPEVTEVLLRDGHLEVSFDEEPDVATAPGAIDLGGFAPTWELAADRFTLRSVETLPEGPYTLTIGTSLTDLVGTGLLAPFAVTFDVDASGTATVLIFAAPDPRLVTTSAVAHDFGFHGLPVDDETGLLYVRHRYYDPELGRFITTDPLGYVDGSNLYQYALNNPVNFSDPLGLCVGAACADLRAYWEPLRQEKVALPGLEPWEREAVAAEMRRTTVEMARGCPGAFPSMFAFIGGMAAGKHPMVHDFRWFGAVEPENKEQLGGQLICGLASGLAGGRLAPGKPVPVRQAGAPRVNLIGPRSVEFIRTGRLSASPPATLDPDAVLGLGRGPLRLEAAQQLLDEGVPRGTARLNVLESSGRTFVSTPNGRVVPVPEGWVARPAQSGRGIVYQRPGASGNADMIRIMDATERYPQGYVRYYNNQGQPLDVFGKPAGRAETHISLDYEGPIPGWPQ